MNIFKIAVLMVFSAILTACAMLSSVTPEKSTQPTTTVSNKTQQQPEQVIVSSNTEQNTEVKKEASATPNIVETQNAQVAAGMINQPGMQSPKTSVITNQTQPISVTPKPPVAQPINVGGQLAISLNVPYQQAWSDVKKALPRAGYPIMEQDNTSGTYYILDKVASGGVIKRDTPIYQLHLQKTTDGKTLLTLNNAQNQPAPANVAERILNVLK